VREAGCEVKLVERTDKAAYWLTDSDGRYLGCVPYGFLTQFVRPDPNLEAAYMAQMEELKRQMGGV